MRRDDEEYQSFVVARYRRLVRAAVLLGCAPQDAEDAAQDALVRCYLAWARVSTADDPDAYVYRVLVNGISRARRRRWHGEVPYDIDVRPAPTAALAQAGRRRLRRRRVVGAGCTVAGVVVVAAGIPLAVAQLRATPPATPRPASTTCATDVPDAVLPKWARAGFSSPAPRIAYVRGHADDMLAVLFAQPLTAPPSPDHNNKILWVARPSKRGPTAGDLRIDARLADGSATAVRTVTGGPGPSIIDLPRPGCWHLTLHWGGRTDSLDLAYAPR